MAIDAAIQNVGEYFSAHYLAGKDGFSKDIGNKVKQWKEQGSQAAPRKLQALGAAFFAAKSKALDYPEPEMRSKAGDNDLDAWYPKLLDALGYQPETLGIELNTEKKQLPSLLRLNRHSQPWLAIFKAPFCISSGDLVEDALEEYVEPVNTTVEGLPTLITEWEKAIALLFKQEDRPRWAILLAGSKIYLFDAHTFAQGRYVYIDLDIAYSGKDKATFDAIAALLAHDCLAPETESDEVLHEKLREGSLKSTHGVSEQLQGAVREAIELIANGWIDARRQKGLGYKQLSEREPTLPDGSTDVTAEQLKHDALVYVYRILFCLYAEARGGELGVLPITDDIYRLGYSMEALRDLADMGEPGTQTEDGSYYAEHLNRLFKLVHEGFHPEEGFADKPASVESREEKNKWAFSFPEQSDMFGGDGKQLTLDKGGRKQLDTGNAKTFVIQPLTATLFDPTATPLLNRVNLSNRILHQVIRRLSLGTGKKGKQIGRINYAELGIVQLGSVYEGLLSYKGFFAKENLIQVVQAGKSKTVKGKNEVPLVFDEAVDPKKPSWFVSESRLEEFKDGEIVLDRKTGKARRYVPGTFILHLNGMDRVTSASYYTPEVLTQALVKKALKERLKDFGPEQADEILELKICEPAMGSAAFLVEAIDQLGRYYLLLKQEQLGRSIDPSSFEEELGRVKHYIAVHNVYGVDLNPTAVELGALSLWLASIHSLKIKKGENGAPDLYRPGQTPWFGLRLRAGNSLIGARRAVWTYDQLTTGKHFGKNALAPRQLKPGEQRKDTEVYHFLVWDEDMAPAARDKLMKSYWPEECVAINDWNKKHVKQKWKPEELAKARDICARVDELWEDYAKHRIAGLGQTECTASVWPTPSSSIKALKPGPSLEFQENLKANLESQSGAFQRLKLLMDSWCSFYFWPLEHGGDLPTRDAWLAAAEVLLGCEAVEKGATRAMLDIALGDEINIDALFAESQQELPDADKLAASVPWYHVASEVGSSQNFHHWELVFTEILGPRIEKQGAEPNGFDLMFGNPPWLVVSWDTRVFLSEFNPLIEIRDFDSSKVDREKTGRLENSEVLRGYTNDFTATCGASSFLSDRTLYPKLSGSASNLYKNFIERCWDLISNRGTTALIHLKGVFDDEKGGGFRDEFYRRLTSLWSFRNERRLFVDVHNGKEFECTTSSGLKPDVGFDAIFYLFDPVAIEDCENAALNTGPVPNIKEASGGWQRRGHPKRKIWVNDNTLKVFSELTECKEGFRKTKLVQLHNKASISALKSISKYGHKLSSYPDIFRHDTLFSEKSAKASGIIHRQDNPSFQPGCFSELVLAGPHFGIANPFFKQARTHCNSNKAYDVIDLKTLPEHFFPMSANAPGTENADYQYLNDAIPHWPPENEKGYVQIDSSSGGLEVVVIDEYIDGPIERTYKYASEEEAGPPQLITSRYRYVNRRMADLMTERTLFSAIYPPGVTHTDGVFGIIFDSNLSLLRFAAMACSVVSDFIIRVNGKTNLGLAIIGKLPLLQKSKLTTMLQNRYLRLICLTAEYKELWESTYSKVEGDSFCNTIQISNVETSWDRCGRDFTTGLALRADASRRIALIEIDVIVCLQVGLTLDELLLINQIYFPVLNQYETVDLYDCKGNRLPNTARKDPGGKELREVLKNHDGNSPVTVSWEIDSGNKTISKTFYPPYKHVDRIEDYKTAYRAFSERLGLENKNKEIEHAS